MAQLKSGAILLAAMILIAVKLITRPRHQIDVLLLKYAVSSIGEIVNANTSTDFFEGRPGEWKFVVKTNRSDEVIRSVLDNEMLEGERWCFADK